MPEETPGEIDDLEAARGGDHRAGKRLMARHGPSMVRTAWSVLGRYGTADADDVVQEAFVAALTTPALPRGDVGAWFRAITVRKALDGLRRRRRRQEQSLPDAEDPGVEATSAFADATLDVLIVRQGLARLRPIDRAVLTLVDLEGRSMAEAAEILGSTRVAVKWRAVRARRQLARELESSTGDSSPAARGVKGQT